MRSSCDSLDTWISSCHVMSCHLFFFVMPWWRRHSFWWHPRVSPRFCAYSTSHRLLFNYWSRIISTFFSSFSPFEWKLIFLLCLFLYSSSSSRRPPSPAAPNDLPSTAWVTGKEFPLSLKNWKVINHGREARKLQERKSRLICSGGAAQMRKEESSKSRKRSEGSTIEKWEKI